MKYEWRKQEQELYGAKKTPMLMTVPVQSYIMISGSGNPNDQDFSNKVAALFSNRTVTTLCSPLSAR